MNFIRSGWDCVGRVIMRGKDRMKRSAVFVAATWNWSQSFLLSNVMQVSGEHENNTADCYVQPFWSSWEIALFNPDTNKNAVVVLNMKFIRSLLIWKNSVFAENPENTLCKHLPSHKSHRLVSFFADSPALAWVLKCPSHSFDCVGSVRHCPVS